MRTGKTGLPGRVLRGPVWAALARAAGSGPAGRRWHRPAWLPVAVYVLIVLAIGGGLVAWDQAYEARQRARFAPPPPQVLVRNLVENIVGRGSVTDVKVDPKASTLDVTIQDVLIKPGQPIDEQKKNVASEGSLAIQFVQSRLRYQTMTVRIVKDGKTLATVRATGQGAPTTEYGPGLK